ncbi:hypothetical protein PQ460_12280 [Paenibacillus sp. KACC 21273]|uniref:hypothetical protein n=1 Tax=Paenibacillus sp. KACC 21273 TaxID=3025665 RepID=UPI0023664A7E|nr:hypothetical protein [Paenibacillus sp. KACC 21273]WDF48798.1 hypothetical protein PQ460_12280 [Paenibacillus sp. KACC 21273]
MKELHRKSANQKLINKTKGELKFMKKCSYCGNQAPNFTKEHIIPSGLLEMYPDQDVTFNNTTTKNRMYKDNQGQSIKDVCANCNNNLLGKLDAYGVRLIRQYFLEKYDEDSTINMKYDYHLLQRWLLKIIYNSIRSSGIESKWFNDEIQYIISDEIQDGLPLVSIFGGIYVDMTAFGEDKALLTSPLSSYQPLYILHSPLILINGIQFNRKRGRSITEDKMKIRRADHVVTIRFASAIFLVVLWNKKTFPSAIEKFNSEFEADYPYILIKQNHNNVILQRSTDSVSCLQPSVIQSKKAMIEADEDIRMVLGGRSISETQEEWNKNWTQEDQQKGRVLIDNLLFPNNKSVQKKYEELSKERTDN